MLIKDILLLLRAEAPHVPALELAMRLAAVHDAAVSGLCLFDEPPAPIADGYAIGQAAIGEVMEARDRRVRALVEPVETAFRAAAEAYGRPAELELCGPSEPAQTLARRARTADLVILPRPGADDGQARDLAGVLLLASGAPCLFAPDDAPAVSGFKRVVLAWNGSANAKRAMDHGLDWFRRAEAVEVLTLDGENAAKDGAAVVAHLERHGARAAARSAVSLSGDDGQAILDACDAFGADLLVMGAYGHWRAAEAMLGGATRGVLASARLPVLMAH